MKTSLLNNLSIALTTTGFILIALAIVNSYTSRQLDIQTQELCWEYAHRDHEKELAPERYKYLGKEFVDGFDWYQSCLDHNRGGMK